MAQVDEALLPAIRTLREWLTLSDIQMVIVSSHRSLQQQAEVFQRKGSALAAPPGKSYHNYGLAVDVELRGYFLPGTNPWNLFGELAERLGFRWGGRFRNPEPWHIDAGSVLTIPQARAWYDQGQYLRAV